MGRSPLDTYSMSDRAGQRSRWSPEDELASVRRRLEAAVRENQSQPEIDRLSRRIRKLEAQLEAVSDDAPETEPDG
ncbi:MAG: hypothetical protein ACREK5_06415 [Gemmatimonadota bacterium]